MRYRHSSFYYLIIQPIFRLLWLGPIWYLRIVRPNLKPRTRVLIVTDSHILLIKNIAGSQQWTLPGGGRHHDETAEQCAKREIDEEVGLELLQLRPVDTSSEAYAGATWNYDCFVAHLDTTQRVTLSYEIGEAQWFPRNDIPSAIRPYALTMIRHYAPPVSNH